MAHHYKPPENFDPQYITKEIAYFRELCQNIIHRYAGSELAEDVYLLSNPNFVAPAATGTNDARSSFGPYGKVDLQTLRAKPHAFAISAIIHGNEVGGLCSLNLFLAALLSGEITFYAPIVVILGNVKAALLGVRGVDEDLNRAFARDYTHNHESQRAATLKPILRDIAFFFDLHQTIGPSPQGFFIFAYHPYRFHFARTILPRTDIITYWDGRYTTEGMCGDHYVNVHKGVAITLELGPKGFHPWGIALGYQALLGAYQYALRGYYGPRNPYEFSCARTAAQGKIFTWTEVVPYPQTGTVEPRLDLHNFQPVKSSFELAKANNAPIYTQQEGLLLFPTYVRAQDADQTLRPHELTRVLKEVGLEDFPAVKLS